MKFPWFSLVCLEITHIKPVSTPRTTTTSAELSSFPTPRPGLKHYPRQKGLNPFLKWKGLSEQTTICSENILVFGRVTYKKFSNHQSHWNKTIHRPHRTIQQSIRSWQKGVNEILHFHQFKRESVGLMFQCFNPSPLPQWILHNSQVSHGIPFPHTTITTRERKKIWPFPTSSKKGK